VIFTKEGQFGFYFSLWTSGWREFLQTGDTVAALSVDTSGTVRLPVQCGLGHEQVRTGQRRQTW